MERRIAKVRFKEGKVEIKEVEQDLESDAENSREIFTKRGEEPTQEFVAALKRLAQHVRTILELPADYADGRIEITGVSFSRTKDGVAGAVITGYVKLDKAPSPFSFNTPHLSFDFTSDNHSQPLMPDEAQADLEVLRLEVQGYLDGKRAQSDLFDGKAAAAGEGRPEIDFSNNSDGSVTAHTSVAKEMVAAGVERGDLEPTDQPNVFKMKGRGKRDRGTETTVEVTS